MTSHYCEIYIKRKIFLHLFVHACMHIVARKFYCTQRRAKLVLNRKKRGLNALEALILNFLQGSQRGMPGNFHEKFKIFYDQMDIQRNLLFVSAIL